MRKSEPFSLLCSSKQQTEFGRQNQARHGTNAKTGAMVLNEMRLHFLLFQLEHSDSDEVRISSRRVFGISFETSTMPSGRRPVATPLLLYKKKNR
jgi:hypothetical protein